MGLQAGANIWGPGGGLERGMGVVGWDSWFPPKPIHCKAGISSLIAAWLSCDSSLSVKWAWLALSIGYGQDRMNESWGYSPVTFLGP